MEKDIRLDRETFLCMAKALGLEAKESHLEALYAYTKNVFPSFKVTEGIDVTDAEPMLTFVLPKE